MLKNNYKKSHKKVILYQIHVKYLVTPTMTIKIELKIFLKVTVKAEAKVLARA